MKRTRPMIRLATHARWWGGALALLPAAASPARGDWNVFDDRPRSRPPSMERFERSADRAEGTSDWQRSPAAPVPAAVHFPGLPPPPQLRQRRTLVGPLTLAALDLRSDDRGGFHGSRPGYRFHITSDGGITFLDRPWIQVEHFYLLGITGTFDVADWLLRRNGDDPYAYDKRQIQHLTGPMRERMGRESRGNAVNQAEAALPDQLRTIWQRSDLPAEDRRRLIFALWDELLDAGDSAATPESSAAARARVTIVAFVRDRLGPGNGYTTQELARLNATRRSRDVFHP
ncbi:MAG TPA: hypothetical protein VGF45_11905 [Polyangia bacterium]